ncbi:hypothetical protein PAECIP112173_02895 [Paenibacillus sp. JJ-100]|uniref:RNA polymerase sigma factor n=1 Tax=Paenibacillus sp. JJ-100 TaxID=2974896 RepID=UPI0022FF7BBA|nr:sigma-70 family RNA polymerase sigma factor [Paenibacillus sp. JJ-100]CAI6080463.1 hypothetical protein PAECIP112173_02895 [Paenibacillus sp. JJ-100]
MYKGSIGRQQEDTSDRGPKDDSSTPGDYTEMSDKLIVEQIRQGNSRAFEEMVHRYRSQLHRYIRGITQDNALADDVVQEGLIRAYMHIDQLMEPGRLFAWLQQIVKNQAYTHIQRKIRLREHYFSSFTAAREPSAPAGSWSEQDVVDHLLNQQMSYEQLEIHELSHDPFFVTTRQDMNHYVHQLLAGLKEKERFVCQQHWIEHRSPQEIASQTGLTIANVYQILSRSRKKMSRHHIHQAVNEMLKESIPLLPQCVLLREPRTFHTPQTWSSAGAAMHEMLSYLEASPSLPMIMGATGLAFRMTIYPEDIHIAGPTAFNFKEVLGRGLRHMGYLPSSVEAIANEAGVNANLVDPALLQVAAKDKRMVNPRLVRALSMIRYSVSRGLPAVVWDLNIPEFGLVYGYDDQARTLHGEDFIQRSTVPYDHLGRGVNEEVFVLTVEPEPFRNELDMQAILQHILAHYKGSDSCTMKGTVSGLAAYAAWREALRTGRIEPNGHAYNIAVLWDARHYATVFFEELAQVWMALASRPCMDKRYSGMDNHNFIRLCRKAKEQYRLIADRLYMLVQRFPFPEGGKPNHHVNADKAFSILEEIEKLECSAVRTLEIMLDMLESGEQTGVKDGYKE